MIALSRGGYYADKLKAIGIPVVVLQKRFRFDPLTWWRLRGNLRLRAPDIVQSFLFSANSFVRLPGVVPSTSQVVVSERCVDSWKSGWQLKLDAKLKSRMTAMTANSNAVAEFYRDRIGVESDRMHVIPNGVPLPDPDSVELRAELGLHQNARIVGFVGRLAAQKCLKDLVWGFHLLQSAIEDVFLVLVGDGPERDGLAELAASLGCRDRIFFLGHRKDASQLVSEFNAFCLPSSFEGMSNSLMDAMSCGVPVAVSDIPANLELVEHESTGLTFPLGQGPEIGRALKRLLEDETLASDLKRNASELIQSRHSVAQMVEGHVSLYRRLVSV